MLEGSILAKALLKPLKGEGEILAMDQHFERDVWALLVHDLLQIANQGGVQETYMDKRRCAHQS